MSPTKRVSARARATAIPTRPQAVGARKKTGCYTCRIRRKKCDETRDSPQGGCETCHRLRLECLGYGDKRPTWLRDRQFLEDTLEKIKKHLTKNGLLRGQHSARQGACLSSEGGTGTLLILNPSIPTYGGEDEDGSTSDSSSSSPTVSFHEERLSSISSVRDEPYEPYEPEFVVDAPYSGGSAIDTQMLAFSQPTIGMYEPYGADPSSSTQVSGFNPGYPSTFGMSYNINEGFYSPEREYPPENEYLSRAEYPRYDESQTFLWPSTSAQAQQTISTSPDYFFRPPFEPDGLSEYFHWVAKKQFLLADQRVLSVIYNALCKSSPAHQAATLLTQLHQFTAQGMHTPKLAQHVESWAASIMAVTVPDQGSALAALQLISCLLHVGGRGPWQTYLDHAIDWVLSSISASSYSPAIHVSRQPADAQFIIRTAMWFDVLGSITRAQPPRLLKVFRDMHRPPQVIGIVDENGSGEIEEEEPMMSIMGCENAIVRALGEISWLAHWRDEQQALGTFSNVEFVQRGLEIESHFLAPSNPPSPSMPTQSGLRAPSAAFDPVKAQRVHTSAVFRASAKLYLHTVLSGEVPRCPEVRAAVKETVAALQQVPADGDAERSIVRMTVFAICLAGCMTDETEERKFLEERLERQQADKVGGNCAEVLGVMRDVWAARARGEPIGWREAVARSPQGLLLLV